MDFHPSQIPIARTFDVKDEKEAEAAADAMVRMRISDRSNGFKVLIPKEKKRAKRIGYTVTTALNNGLRSTDQKRDLRYWTYHHDKNHYAIVFVSNSALAAMNL